MLNSNISVFNKTISSTGESIYSKTVYLYEIIYKSLESYNIAVVISIFSFFLAYYSLRYSNKQSKKQADIQKKHNLLQENLVHLRDEYNQFQKRQKEIQDYISEQYKAQSEELYRLQSRTDLIIEYMISDKTNNAGIFTLSNRGMSKAKNITFSYKLEGKIGSDYQVVTNNGRVIDKKEVNIFALDPNESSSIVVMFSRGPQAVEVFYAWDNVDGERVHRNRELSPLCF